MLREHVCDCEPSVVFGSHHFQPTTVLHNIRHLSLRWPFAYLLISL